MAEENIKKVPVIWNYLFDEIIGAAVLEDDGTVSIKLVDPRIKELIEQKTPIRAISISHRPLSHFYKGDNNG